MAVIKNVALAGANGDLGTPVLNAIVEAGKFNVTVIVRDASKGSYPSSVKVVEADYNSVPSLTSALKGQDALVSTVGSAGLDGQTKLVDACVAAGVYRFLPSEFGSDLSNPKTKVLPVFGSKVKINDYVEKTAAQNSSFTYTNVRNGAFLDWGLGRNFLLNTTPGAKTTIWNDGDQPFSSTNLATVGRTVAAVLQHPDETVNRAVRVQEAAFSQNQLLAIYKKTFPDAVLEVEHANLPDAKSDADAKIASGDFSLPVLFTYLFVSVLQPGYGGHMESTDNELLGVANTQLTEDDVAKLFKEVVAKR